ncbi:MAG: hypothetical protein ABJF23_22045 [Bryobacteraceae bacterium]
MKLVAALAFLAASYTVIHAASNATPRVSRVSVRAMEDSIDSKVTGLQIDDPFQMVGGTRGMYINGYGVVFASEMDLVANTLVSPFRPQVTKEDLTRLRHKKEQRIVILRQVMRKMLMSTAASLDGVPPNEQVVLGITLHYYPWEDAAGLPRQIVMLAPRKLLIEAMKGDPAILETGLQVQEY